jgi:uncharacterized protein (TIGR03435 family)
MKVKWFGAMIVAVGIAHSQTGVPTRSEFETASIKVNKSGARQESFEMLPGGERLVVRNGALSGLIMRAYDVHQNQVSGSPLALSLMREPSERYDLDAKAEHPASRSEMMRMLQTLLADRFQLRLRTETREVSGFALTMAEGGSKLSDHTGALAGDCSASRGNDGELTFRNCSMSFFASQMLTGIMGTYVVDKTGLQGSYDIHLMASWEMPGAANPAENPDAGDSPRIVNSGAPSIFAALPKQLGLKLERQRVAVQFIYIDHAEKPSGN